MQGKTKIDFDHTTESRVGVALEMGQIDSSSLGVGEGSATEAGERARSCGRYGAGTSDVS